MKTKIIAMGTGRLEDDGTFTLNVVVSGLPTKEATTEIGLEVSQFLKNYLQKRFKDTKYTDHHFSAEKKEVVH